MVYLYAMDVSRLNADPEVYHGLIPEHQIARLSAMPSEARLLSLAAELLFQRAVKRHCRGIPLPVNRDAEPNGKPYLLGVDHFHFSLSHSGIWAVCAVADCPIGVDIQQERPVSLKLARKFSPKEQQSLQGLPGPVFNQELFSLWVLKEAFTKCTGEGLLRSFKSFEARQPAPGYSSQLVEFPAGRYHVAVCVQQEEMPEVQILIMPS